MLKLRMLFGAIIGARIAIQSVGRERPGGFERVLARLPLTFKLRPSRSRYKPHQGAQEIARRVRQGHTLGQNCRFTPRPHSAKFAPGAKQPLPQRRGWRWKPYYQNPDHDPHYEVAIDDGGKVLERVCSHFLSGHQSGKTQERNIVYSGIKWRHLNER